MRQTGRSRFRRAVVAGLGLLGAVGLPAPALPVVAQTETSDWTERQPMLLPRSEASVVELNGKIYFMGGYPGARITSDSVQVYDAQTDSWELGPPLPRPLHHTMAAVANGKLFIIGGEAGNPTGGEGNDASERGVFDLNERYDPTANAWHSHEPLPLAMHGITGAAFLDGLIYVPGGATRRGVSGQDVTLKLQTFRVEATCNPPA